MTVDEIVAWFRAKREVRQTSDEAVSTLASSHPRTVFIKTLPPGLDFLQIAPEFGAIDVFLKWPPPQRNDLRLFAFTSSTSKTLSAYGQIEIGNFDRPERVYQDKKFGAVMCSMLLHRLADPAPLMQWISEHTLPQARIFLEWASPFSTLLPTRAELSSVNIDLLISNFADDSSNIKIHERSRVVSMLSKNGFFVECQGHLSLPFCESEILAHHARGLKDDYALLAAFWSKTKWIQYLVGVRQD